jgi:hypothetical protein
MIGNRKFLPTVVATMRGKACRKRRQVAFFLPISKFCGWKAKCLWTGTEVVGLPAMAGCIPLYLLAEGRRPGLTSAV